MNYSVDLKKELVDILSTSCIKQLERLKSELSEQSVFAYAIFCSNGCSSMNIAACTREGLDFRNLKTHNRNQPEWYREVNSSEWNYYNKDYELFSEVNTFIDELFEIFYDGDLDDGERDNYDDDELWEFISDFFIDACVQVLINLRKNQHFKDSCFEGDLLLGMQFGDPDKYALDMIKKSSKRLNSSIWHKKVMINSDLIEKSLKSEFVI